MNPNGISGKLSLIRENLFIKWILLSQGVFHRARVSEVEHLAAVLEEAVFPPLVETVTG